MSRDKLFFARVVGRSPYWILENTSWDGDLFQRDD